MLRSKLEQLTAMLLAITGSQGIDVLNEMGDDSANAYLAACLSLARECLADVEETVSA